MAIVYRTLVGTDNADFMQFRSEVDGDDEIYYTTLQGNGGNDIITIDATTPRMTIEAGDGDDAIFASYANKKTAPQIFAGAGDDLVVYQNQAGHQTVHGGEGDDVLRFSGILGAGEITGFETLQISQSMQVDDSDLSIFQTVSLDTPQAGAAFVLLSFANSADLTGVNFVTGKDTLEIYGSEDADVLGLAGLSGNFYVLALGGNDTIIAGDKAITAVGGLGDDYIVGSKEDDLLSGYELLTRTGAPGKDSDTVLGKAGDDVLNYSGGDLDFDGGRGDDMVQIYTINGRGLDLRKLDATFTETLAADSGRILVDTASLLQFDLLTGSASLVFQEAADLHGVSVTRSSNFSIIGSSDDDFISFKGVNGGMRFFGAAGDDTIVGMIHNDQINGGKGNDIIDAGGGADWVYANAGEDRIDTGDGDDHVQITNKDGKSGQTLDTGEGNDHIYITDKSASGHGFIDGGLGRDTLHLSGDLSGYDIVNVEGLIFKYSDVITGDADTLGSFSKFTMTGFAISMHYAFVLSGGGDFDWKAASDGIASGGALTGSDEGDTVNFSVSKLFWDINTGAGDDAVYGGRAGDVIKGGDGDDILSGEGGHDDIAGGAGNDALVGGAGGDLLRGGLGADHFVYTGKSGYDWIKDFEAEGADHDVIEFDDGAGANINHLSDLDGRLFVVGGDLAIVLDHHVPDNFYNATNVIRIEGKAHIDLTANLFEFN